jgi:hypothetical protein
MKSIQPSDTQPATPEDLLPEYRFDYSKARPNRFAQDRNTGSRMIVLDPDIAEVFTTAASVNAVLRALIATMPKTTCE